MKKMNAKTGTWNMQEIFVALILPAAMAVLPGIRKRYGMATFSIPSLALMAGLWLWQRKLEKRGS